MLQIVECFNPGPQGAYRYAAWFLSGMKRPCVSYAQCPLRAARLACRKALWWHGRAKKC